MLPEDIFATVNDLIKILQKIALAGKGDYLVRCNDEYYVAKKEEDPEISDKYKEINLGGYS